MKKYVVARLKGGLGNQLFIYSTALAFATKQKLPLLIDSKSGFWRDRYKRHFELDAFNLSEQHLPLWVSFLVKFLDYFPDYISNFFTIKRISDQDRLLYDSSIYISKYHRYLLMCGYWQDEDYFKQVKDEIKRNFYKSILFDQQEYLRLSKQINCKPEAVCIHGRLLRAFASDGTLVSTNDPRILPPSFFEKAIIEVLNKLDNPHFFIFSDDPVNFINIVNSLNVSINYSLVQHNYSLNSTFDFSLMMSCKHFIISNSTYSWWAAWLSETSDTIVIAPENSYWDNQNIVPKRWNKLK